MPEQADSRPSAPAVTDLMLERYALRELPAADLRRMEERLAADPALRERLRALEDSGRALLEALPPAEFARGLQARRRREDVEKEIASAHGNAERGFGFAGPRPLLGSLALLIVLAVPAGIFLRHGLSPDGNAAGGAPIAEDDIRIKGLEPHLAIFRKTDQGSEPLHPGAKARPGEFLRIGYQAGGFSYGAILSVDGNGSVTRHWPVDSARAARLENGEALLPSAFELDAAPDYERFYLIVSDRPFELNPFLEFLRKREALPEAPAKTRIVRFDVLKENGI